MAEEVGKEVPIDAHPLAYLRVLEQEGMEERDCPIAVEGTCTVSEGRVF